MAETPSTVNDEHQAFVLSAAEEHQAEVLALGSALPPALRLPLTTAAVLDDRKHPAVSYLLGLRSETSHATQRWALNTAARVFGGNAASFAILPWEALTMDHVEALAGVLAKRYEPATANRVLTAVKCVLYKAYQHEKYPREEYERVSAVKAIEGTRLPPGRLLEPAELDTLLGVCRADKTVRGSRDEAAVGLLYGCGLRRSEAAKLLREELAEASLMVIGKRNKQRQVPLSLPVASALARWSSLRGADSGSYLRRLVRRGRQTFVGDKALQPSGLWEALGRRRVEAKLEPFSPHDLRRSFITHLLDAGVDVVAVQKLVGHADPTTTALYDRRQQERLKEFVTRLPFPLGS